VPLAVVVGRRTSVAPADAHALARSASAQLVERKVPLKLDADAARGALARLGLKDAAACNGRKACLTELGRQLGVAWLVSLSVAQVGSDRSVAVDLLEVASGNIAEREALILAPRVALAPDAFSAFAERVRQRLSPAAPPPPVIDRPLVEAPPPPPLVTPPAAPAPAPAATTVVAEAPPAAPKSRAAPVVLGIAAGAALVASGVLLASGLAARGEAYRTERVGAEERSPYSASEVQARAGAANGQLGVAGGVGAVALGLGVAMVLTW
jgi:hypothetical protein